MLVAGSLLNLEVGDEDVSIGPIALLTSLLAVVDRAVDRRRAAQRSCLIGKVMNGVSFAKAKISLSAYCIQLMQNLSLEDQQKLRTAVDALSLTDMDDELKSHNLGLLLMNTVGPPCCKPQCGTSARKSNERGGYERGRNICGFRPSGMRCSGPDKPHVTDGDGLRRRTCGSAARHRRINEHAR